MSTSQKYSVNQHLIETLLSWVKSGEIAIPEIQRPFVWKPTKVRDLMDSLYQGYPVGYIIAWKNPSIRLKDGSLSEGRKILIDGQQRVTALTAAMVGQRVVNKDYREVRIKIAFNPLTEAFEVTNPAIEKSKQWLPDIAPIVQGEIGLLKLIRQYRETNPDVDEEHLEAVFTKLLDLKKRQVGLIELNADLDIETVTEIFIRINSKGVVLSQADFVMSKIAANETFGGNVLRKAIDYFCHLAVAPEFFPHIRDNDAAFAATDYFKQMKWLKNENDDLYDPSYVDMLRVAFTSQFSRGRLEELVALLSGRNFETREYEQTIEEASYATLKTGIEQFMNETNFKRFVMIIKSAGFVDKKLIRAQSPVNFAYILYLKLIRTKTPKPKIESFVRRWFVLSMLTGRYASAPESKFDQDSKAINAQPFGEFLDSIEQSELSDAFWDVGLPRSLTTSNVNHPTFNVFLASQAHANDRGFLSKDITVGSLLIHRGDIHHINPKAYLKRQGHARGSYNQVANYVYMQQETNIAVGDKPPEKYLAEVKMQCETGEAKYGGIVDLELVKKNFAENAIPMDLLEEGPTTYEDFLAARRQLMAAKIRDYYFSL
ncbi:GmrSD restriction endonuclease domain-containing protein [Neorhodopirellula lusitana]|uniref:GmrSD restriction endonuclease domain-containing protein n=1 Tax=Neorhodopirellula lusitana TaxID=445327 RepID=UPI00384D399A